MESARGNRLAGVPLAARGGGEECAEGREGETARAAGSRLSPPRVIRRHDMQQPRCLRKWGSPSGRRDRIVQTELSPCRRGRMNLAVHRSAGGELAEAGGRGRIELPCNLDRRK